jgi:hypothetical protein
MQLDFFKEGRLMRGAIVIGALLLAACSSGSADNPGGGGGPTPTPTPTPTPSPTPTSTPTPTYTAYDALIGDQVFQPICSDYNYRISFNSAAQSYSIISNYYNETYATFGPVDIDPTVTDAVHAYVRTNPRGGIDRFTIRRPVVGGVPLDYVRTGEFSVLPTYANPARSDARCVFGTPTIAGDRPATGTRVINLVVSGTVTRTGSPEIYSLSHSTITARANYDTRIMDITGQFIGTPMSGGPDVVITEIDSSVFASATFGTGLLVAGDPGLVTGYIQGGFFGPHQKELAAMIGLSGPTGRNDLSGRAFVFGL